MNFLLRIIYPAWDWLKRQILVATFLFGPISVFSQMETQLDAKTLNDSAIFFFKNSRFEKALSLATQAQASAEKLQQKEELSRAYLILGNIQLVNGLLRESQQLFKKSFALASEINNTALQSKALSNWASAFLQLGEYDSAENYLLESIRLDTTDKSGLISNYGRLGLNRKKQQHYATAIEYYLKSLALSTEIKDSLIIAKTLANIGNIYFEQKEHQRALDYYQQALSLLDSSRYSYSISGISIFAADAHQMVGNLDEAEKILKRALVMARKLQLVASEALALESLGTLQFKRGKTDEAIALFKQALGLLRKIDSWSEIESVLLELGEAYIVSKQYEKASVALHEGMSIGEKHKHAIGLKEFYLQMSRLDSAKGNFKSALAYYQKSTYYKDSLFTVEKMRAMEEINKKFATQQKEKVIEEQQRIIDEQRAKQLFFVVIIVVIAVSAGFIFLFAHRKRRIKRDMEHEQQRKQKLLDIVVAQEQMQQKIARDIHDSLVQMLSAAKISVESLKALSSESQAEKLQEVAQIIDQGCQEARTISHQLLPYSLQKHGLVLALEELFEKNIKPIIRSFEFNCSGFQNRLKDTIEINVYRIAQELINNIIKHADAKSVQVLLSDQNNQIVLKVSDNGKGFNTIATRKGAGLLNIESRLQLLRGTLMIESKTGEGTKTTITIPL